MKKINVIIIMMLCLSTAIFAQSKKSVKQDRNSDDQVETVKYFLGTTGVFKGAYGILGLQFSANVINPNVYATAGVGRSFAGVKFGADLQHFSKANRRGFAYGAGLAYVAGPTGSAFINDSQSGISYTLNKRNALVINTFIGGHFKLGRKSTFYIQTGYGIPTNKVYTISNFSGSADELSGANVGLSFTTPHGFMTGIGFMFGF